MRSRSPTELHSASIAHLETYRRLIKHYVELCTSKCWAVVYQADTHARLELAERLRIEAEEHARLREASEYDTTRPWEYVWKRIPQQHSFWRKEVEEPCFLALSQTTGIDDNIEGDAPVGGSGSMGLAHKRRAAPAQPQQHPAKRQAFERQHKVCGEGHLATNRRGIPLCKLIPGQQLQGSRCA